MRFSSFILLGTSSIALARVAPAPPVITPPPTLEDIDLSRRQNSVDLASLAQVLMTAVPPSLLGLALTNVPALSKQLWSEFLDDNTPSWFTALPTDVQRYLSGQFGPTTAASNTRVSVTSSASTSASTATGTASSQTSNPGKSGGLPLWAKIVIGIAVPLIFIALVALVVVCCLRRRRRRRAGRESRTPTPAFISSSYRPTHANRHAEQEAALRGGHASSPEYHTSSGSDDFHTPIGGPSYEDMPPAVGVGMQQRNRGSRQSFSSLHSVPEVPETMHDRHHVHSSTVPMPPPPRSPRRSRDMSNVSPLANAQRRRSSSLGPTADSGAHVTSPNPAYHTNQGRYYTQEHPYSVGQGIYAGGQNPYPTGGYKAYSPHDSNPFTDPSPQRQSYMASGGYRGSAGSEPNHDSAYARHSPDDYENEWPLKSPRTSQGFIGHEQDTRAHWERGQPGQPIYEMH